MPEYTIEELKKYNLSEFEQVTLFGGRLEELEKSGIKNITTWLDLGDPDVATEGGKLPSDGDWKKGVKWER